MILSFSCSSLFNVVVLDEEEKCKKGRDERHNFKGGWALARFGLADTVK